MNRILTVLLIRLAGATLLVGSTAVQAQSLAVQWSNDPETQGWADTYQAIYSADWQNGIDPQIGVQANPDGITLEDDPVITGRKVLRASISRSEDFSKVANGSPRAELMFPEPVRFAQGKDYLIRWSTFLPATFEFDSKQLIIIAQINQGSSTGGPTIALSLLGTQYAISERGGANIQQVSGGQWLCCADADRGKWVYWTLRYVPDETGQHAVTELYKGGKSVFATKDAANAYPNVQNAYLKIGLYKPFWTSLPSNVTQSTIFYGPVHVSQY